MPGRILIVHDPNVTELARHECVEGLEFAVSPVDSACLAQWLASACDVVKAARKQYAGVLVIYPIVRESERLVLVRELIACGADDAFACNDPDLSVLVCSAAHSISHSIELQNALEEYGLVGHSDAMRRFRSQLARAITCKDAPVLLLGETGTGKFLAATALHKADPCRSDSPFHALDCGAVNEGLFGSELFGHVRGAFTGALSSRPGALASAGKGTLLLDEVGDLSLSLQANFLTTLQERRFRAVGSDREQNIECRIVSATNKDLPELVKRGVFREDLFYRLDGVRIILPPLSKRREDIPLLFDTFARRHASSDPDLLRIDPEVSEFLASIPFPGNARQLDAIARAAVAAAGTTNRIRLTHACHAVGNTPALAHDGVEDLSIGRLVGAGMPMEAILNECKKMAVEAALRLADQTSPSRSNGKRMEFAAKRLGVSVRYIYNLRPPSP